jgi:Tfp pilus assembly protein PilZ
MENRFFRRVKINHEIKALAQDGYFIGRLINISLGGLFLKTKKTISVGEQIEIDLPLRSDYEINNFAAKLIAIRNEAEGIAFKFINLDPKNFWTLQSFINYES